MPYQGIRGREEVGHIRERNVRARRPTKECWQNICKALVSIRWEDTNKSSDVEWDLRRRLVARGFKGGQEQREHLFAETPPLEGESLLIAGRRPGGKIRNEGNYCALMRRLRVNSRCGEMFMLCFRRRVGVWKGCVRN